MVRPSAESDDPPRGRELARVVYLKVANYRALRSIEIKDITPFTVLLGPNGSGKSTVVDVFAFLSFFLNAVGPGEVRILYRDDDGYSQAVRAADIQGIPEFVDSGASLGHLWLEGRFGMGDPLVNAGAPRARGTSR